MKDGSKVDITIDLRIGKGNIYIGRPAHEKVDFVMKMKEDTFIKLFVHKMNPVKAFVLGQLKLEGSKDQLTKFA